MEKTTQTRREALKHMGLLSAAGTTIALGLSTSQATGQNQSDSRSVQQSTAATNNRNTLSSRDGFLAELKQRVDTTPMVDSHEHLQDEVDRLNDNQNCMRLFRNYIGDDFASAGLIYETVFGKEALKEDPIVLWRRLEPYWNAVKHGGYARAAQITFKELYGIDKLEERVIPQLQQAFEKLSVKGFYEKILREHCRLESCQVMRTGFPFTETTQPTLLLQDICISDFQFGPVDAELTKRVGITELKNLNDYHDFLRRWFKKYGPYATAVKCGIAYNRGLDFEKVPAELAEMPFKKRVENARLNAEETKLLQDHLFWFCADLADEYDLPVKLHTGHYAGSNYMPFSRVAKNVEQAADLCVRSPKTRFMFMHTAYPFGHELIAVAKHFTNALIQTCWAWIIDPVGTKNFLKQYIVTAPTNKINLFGGDYHHVENVVGHARIARNGLYAALSELVDEGYIDREEAFDLAEALLRRNGRRMFNLEKKYEAVRNAPWNKK